MLTTVADSSEKCKRVGQNL